MGAIFPCCNDTSVSHSTKVLNVTENETKEFQTRSRSLKRDLRTKNLTKKGTVKFDKSKFFHEK
jgi:hypothetical protein